MFIIAKLQPCNNKKREVINALIPLQYARPCRYGQNVRPCCKRNDRLVNVNFSISVDFVVCNGDNMVRILLSQLF